MPAMTRDLVRAQKCLRRLVIAYNIFFWVTGPGIVGLGAWVYVALDEYEPAVMRRDFDDPAYIIIIAGATSIVAGIVGCLGGVNEHKRLLKLYFLLMFVVCCLEISATVYSFLLYDDMESTIKITLKSATDKYRQPDNDVIGGIDYVQKQLSCCGVEKPTDWLKPAVAHGNTTGESLVSTTIPSSCCPGDIPLRECTLNDSFRKGCLSELLSWTQTISKISGWTIFAMACTQLLALAVICCFTEAVSYVQFW